MSTQQQQQHTAEKSVQTQDLSGSTTLLVTNHPVGQLHTENTTTEVANTLVSMATGRQRSATVKQLVNKIIFLFHYKTILLFIFRRMESVFQIKLHYQSYLLLILQLHVVFQPQWL
jgi:hypothetical protein